MLVDRDGAATQVSLPQDEIESLQATIRGTVFVPGSDGYDAARQVWNGVIDRYPAAVIRCHGVPDVVEAVRFARGHPLPVSIRAGGHQVAGSGVCDDGIVIDVGPMTGVHVDPVARTARVQAGARWTARPSSSAWPRRAGRSASRGWPASPSAAGWAPSSGRSGWRATACSRWRS